MHRLALLLMLATLAAAPALAGVGKRALTRPEKATAQAPASYVVELDTTEGQVLIEVRRHWAPIGADRFYNLVKLGFYDDNAFFRVLPGFIAQVGIPSDPKVARAWSEATIPDDPVTQTNAQWTVTFATAGPDTRTTQIFINYADNARLDGMGFAPFGRVVKGEDALLRLHAGYGEGAPLGQGPDQGRIEAEGLSYLKADFADLDYIKRAGIRD